MRMPFLLLTMALVSLAACTSERDYYGDRWQHGDPLLRRAPYYPDGYRRSGACEPADALAQGRRAGLRSPAVRDVTPDRVVVGGYGGQIVLRNRPGCPYARY
ncbi:exported hypothetical protein [uncultured Pleomorphomonas sp.]|uniref:Lipoprotein n=1 Tax=uncultured Pleomorphomonas sp. TaxID=442121 RepID=A0A212L0N1_9HYPH|nr:hypothetical protein [uncultured Pleomorphomonas sp.]SCM71131.1 exported hypothetical protein [uncultured Pleomorphomonas sp.]